MKKVIFFAAAFMFICSSSAFAEYGTGNVTLGETETLDIQTSSNVYLDYEAGGTTGDTFSVATYHDKGTRTYASTSADSIIYYQDATAVAIPDAPTGTETMDATDWESL